MKKLLIFGIILYTSINCQMNECDVPGETCKSAQGNPGECICQKPLGCVCLSALDNHTKKSLEDLAE